MSAGRIVIMGSGETAPTMVKVHRFVRETTRGPIVALDTPYGFQENADELSTRTTDYFRDSVGADLTIASFRRPDEVGTVAYEAAMARLAEAGAVFAGPGSPSYALATWRASAVPDQLARALERGATLTFASAAALTLGRFTVPVYEIYKVGTPAHWLDGLGMFELLTGVTAAVVPHYDNSEGGTHDTRFCYLGERRLNLLESELPDGAIVFGVDEHTAAVLAGAERTITVMGRGELIVRRGGSERRFGAGTTFSFDDLRDDGRASGAVAAESSNAGATAPAVTSAAPTTLAESAVAAETAYGDAVAARDGVAAAGAALDLEAMIRAWASDPSQTDDVDRARAGLRSIVVRLGEAASSGLADPAALVAPFVEALLELRAAAREAGRYSEADAVRDRLVEAGVEINDGPTGTTWRLA